MKLNLLGAVVIAAIALLAMPIAESSDCSGTGPTLKTACGSTIKNNCRGKCYCTYEAYTCGNPKPGGIAQHKKELNQCYAACKGGK